MTGEWRKSSYSFSNSNCVQVASLPDGVAVRDSKLGDESPVLTFPRGEWDAFLAAVRSGEFAPPGA